MSQTVKKNFSGFFFLSLKTKRHPVFSSAVFVLGAAPEKLDQLLDIIIDFC